MSLPALVPPGGSGGPLVGRGWDYCKIGGIDLPGNWRVTSGGLLLKMDHKRKAGADGSNPVFHGLDPQRFEIEGTQWTDEQRNQLLQVLPYVLPEPGTTQNQIPLQLQHPSVLHFGFAINVMVLGCGILEYVGPCVTRLKIHLAHWLQPKTNAPAATNQPVRATRNKRTEAAEALNQSNPLPTEQPGFAGPPLNFTPGQ